MTPKDIIIRECFPEEIGKVVELWFEVSVEAHDFIPPDYWSKNKAKMASDYLPAADTLVAVDGVNVVGFISIVGDYLAAIFVRSSVQGKGIGSMLLNEIKKGRNSLGLRVYKKNKKSVGFYQNQGFKVESEEWDKETGENELVMIWKSSQTGTTNVTK